MAKHALLFLALAIFTAGCATSTVDKRKQERASVYSGLAPELQSLVDQGQIQIGMPMDAVYIAWGKPSQVANGQASNGNATTTWVYTGTTWREHRYWNYRRSYGNRYGYPEMYLDYDYIPSSYVSAEVVFENGLVKSWRNISQPPPY
jgi:hypothetical protein